MIRVKEIISRITGMGIGPVSLSWNPPETERKIAGDLVAALGDRRVLFDKGCGSDRAAMIASVTKIRDELTETLKRLPLSSDLRLALSRMRSACHAFQSRLEALHISPKGYGGPEEDLFMAIGQFRGRIGESLAIICAACEIDLEDHFESILPPAAHDAA
jgi:hypothetical protein